MTRPDTAQEQVGLFRRVERAEKAALGAITALQPLIAAVDGLFKSAGSNDSEVYGAAVERLRTAHNDALAWVREEARRVGA